MAVVNMEAKLQLNMIYLFIKKIVRICVIPALTSPLSAWLARMLEALLLSAGLPQGPAPAPSCRGSPPGDADEHSRSGPVCVTHTARAYRPQLTSAQFHNTIPERPIQFARPGHRWRRPGAVDVVIAWAAVNQWRASTWP